MPSVTFSTTTLRTSHRIQTRADRLSPGVVSDVDAEKDSRKGTASLFDEPPPPVVLSKDAAQQPAGLPKRGHGPEPVA